MLVTKVAVSLQALFDDPLQFVGNVGIELNRRYGSVLHDGKKQDTCGIALKRHFAGRHLVERHSKREQVEARIHWLTECLFGRHVRHRPEGPAADGSRRGSSDLGVTGNVDLGQSEVEDLDPARRGHEDVGRLDVAMNHLLCMRRFESVEHLDRDVDQAIQLQWAPLMRSFNVVPSRNSMAMKARPSASPMS